MSDHQAVLVLQEGGASNEIYAHWFDCLQDAEEYRFSAADSSYRTSEPIIATQKMADDPEVNELLVEALKQSLLLDYPPDPEEMGKQPLPPSPKGFEMMYVEDLVGEQVNFITAQLVGLYPMPMLQEGMPEVVVADDSAEGPVRWNPLENKDQAENILSLIEGASVDYDFNEGEWCATYSPDASNSKPSFVQYGETEMAAALKCAIQVEKGDHVPLPEGLLISAPITRARALKP